MIFLRKVRLQQRAERHVGLAEALVRGGAAPVARWRLPLARDAPHDIRALHLARAAPRLAADVGVVRVEVPLG